MTKQTNRIVKSVILLVFLVALTHAEQSIRERIQKHRAWLNQRKYDRQLVGYVETNDPYQKIKYFKKLIKFKNKNDQANEVVFVPHGGKLENNNSISDMKNDYDSVRNLSSNSFENTGNMFLYDLIYKNDEVHNIAKNNAGNFAREHNPNKHTEHNINIVNETIEKQISNGNVIDRTSTTHIKKEQIGNKIHNDVDIHYNNSFEFNGSSTFKNSKNNSIDSLNDLEIQKFINEHIKYNSYNTNVTIKKNWSKWSFWSDCSRSCGEGIKSQSRECLLKMYEGGKKINTSVIPLTECIGLHKRYRLCNIQNCVDPQDFRKFQCSTFNNQSFRGLQYEWEPYIKDGAECELNCKPVNQKYFARLKEYVVDGTECKTPSSLKNKIEEYNKAVCIEGKCKAVYKNGMIIGSSVNNGNIRCGNVVCRAVSEVFGKNPLPNGYVHITTIPATASNITIMELEDSINLLVLKTTESNYIINGNYTASSSGTYELGGTEFVYHRIDDKSKDSKDSKERNDKVKEWITSQGPLFEPVHLLMLSQQTNPGIKYEYLLPINFATSEEGTSSDTDYSLEENLPINSKLKAANRQQNTESTVSTKRKRKFSWKIIGFTECNKLCGGGIQHPIVRCVKGENNNEKIYSRKKCAHLKHPVVNEGLMKCNIQPCPAFWKLSDWTNCKCENANPTKSREVKCVQELISGVVIQVNSGACSEERPVNSLTCECSKNHARTSRTENNRITNQSILQSQSNTQNDQKIHLNRTSKIKPAKTKKAGVWLTSDWSDECLGECGHPGQQFRMIFCDRSMPNMERCDIRSTPNVYKECTSTSTKCQEGSWFIGPWSTCIGDCWNSSKSRTVVCIKDESFAEESECDLSMKPSTFEDCKMDDMKDCKAKWHFSDWSECSKSCGNGMQKRTIKCLEVDKNDMTLRESKNCKYSERPSSMRYCNTNECSDTSITPRVDIIQNDDPQCKDNLSNCHIVLQKRNLCAYHYYNENCCQSCRLNY